MLIAQQKQQENIAEYILYMYQIEDIVRAFQFDLTKIVEHTVLSLTQDEVEINAYRTWYQGIISQMKAQRIEQQGHLAEIQDIQTNNKVRFYCT